MESPIWISAREEGPQAQVYSAGLPSLRGGITNVESIYHPDGYVGGRGTNLESIYHPGLSSPDRDRERDFLDPRG